MRRYIFAANWKMHKTIQETHLFLEELALLLPPTKAKIWIAPPFTALAAASRYVQEKKLPIEIGAQNVAEAQQGAFTGEISATMLKEVGTTFCIIGHSERRTLYAESDSQVHNKIRSALSQGLRPVLCIGESAQEREEGMVQGVLHLQLAAALQGLSSEDLALLVIAYEPVWAIGSGKAATPALAQEAHAICRAFLAAKWGAESAKKIPILYGGSVKPENVASLLEQPDIDGALVGGASLDPKHFVKLLTCVQV